MNNKEELKIIEGDKEKGIIGIFFKEKLVKRVPHKAGKVEGTMEIFDTQGILIETIDYISGQRNGMHIKYNKGKIILEEQYQDDKLNGRVVTYYSDGSIESVSHYRNGKQEGELVVYDRRGNVVHNTEHMDGYISMGSSRNYDRHECINEFENFEH